MEPSNEKERKVRYEWDERKDRANFKKHGIPFQMALRAFDDRLNVTIEDEYWENEQRFLTFGCVENLLLLVVVHTTRTNEGVEVIRIISARKATPSERRLYEEYDR